MEKPPIREVTDILDGIIPFIQTERLTVLMYQCVCPWCTKDVGVPMIADTYGHLFIKCMLLMEKHMKECSYRKVDSNNLDNFRVKIKGGKSCTLLN